MLALTRKTDYALLAMTDLARHPADAASASDLASRLRLPLPLLRNILKLLKSKGFVQATQGRFGGYQLAAEPDSITLAGVIEAVEGPIHLTMCASEPSLHGDRQECDLACDCDVRGPIQHVSRLLRQFLSEFTLADLAANRNLAGLVPAQPTVDQTPLSVGSRSAAAYVSLESFQEATDGPDPAAYASPPPRERASEATIQTRNQDQSPPQSRVIGETE